MIKQKTGLEVDTTGIGDQVSFVRFYLYTLFFIFKTNKIGSNLNMKLCCAYMNA